LPEEYAENYGGTLVAGPAGRLHLAYWDGKAGNNVIYRTGAPTGAGWRPPVDLSGFGLDHPQPQQDPSLATPGLAVDSTDGVHVVFSELSAIRDTHSVGRLFYRFSRDSGVTWDPVLQLGSSALAASPQVVVHNGRLHLVWIDFRDNNTGSEIYYRNQDLTGETPPYGATYSPAPVPNLTISQATTVAVTVTNTGSLTWGANSLFRLAYHWATSGGSIIVWDGLRTVLPQSVGPGQSLTLTASLQAPATAGTYTLKWDLVQDGVTWFSSPGVATGNQTVTVQ